MRSERERNEWVQEKESNKNGCRRKKATIKKWSLEETKCVPSTMKNDGGMYVHGDGGEGKSCGWGSV
jgi:hypothetical protein